MQPFIVGIAGGTASGKTTIASAYVAGTKAAWIAHDRYYRNHDAERGVNFDHPDAVETELLVSHLDALRSGVGVDLPVYDFASHHRQDRPDRLEPCQLLVVEGILTLSSPELRARFDLSVYVDAPDDIRLLRRILRDTRERGRTMDDIADQYLRTVRPMHEAFVRPSMAYASLVLDGMATTESQVARLAAAVSDARARVGR